MVAPLVAAGIGAGVGALNHLFGGGGPQTSTTSIGGEDADYLRYRRALARGWADQGMGQVDPALLAALQGYGGYADAGRMGLAAFTDPSIMAKFQAYDTSVANPIFDRQRAQLEADYRKRMAGAGAFGVRGQMMGPNYSDINNAQLQFGMGAADRARQIAMQFANYGQFGIAGQQGIGQYLTDRPMNYQQGMAGILANSYGGPISQSTTTPNPNDSGSLFQSMLGGAMTGASFGSRPIPTPAASFAPSPGLYSGGYDPMAGGVSQYWRPDHPSNPWADM